VAFEARRFERDAPRWKLADLAGKSLTLASLEGKVVVLDFWGSWCGPCKLELPHLQKLYERYRARGVAFVTVNWEMAATAAEHRRAAAAFMEENGYTFPVLVDHEQVAVKAHGVEAYPTAFVIDRAGRIRYRNRGYTDGIEHILEAQIEDLLKAR
jgi:thiol-disulfide isomerase/thioredoxin